MDPRSIIEDLLGTCELNADELDAGTVAAIGRARAYLDQAQAEDEHCEECGEPYVHLMSDGARLCDECYREEAEREGYEESN